MMTGVVLSMISRTGWLTLHWKLPYSDMNIRINWEKKPGRGQPISFIGKHLISKYFIESGSMFIPALTLFFFTAHLHKLISRKGGLAFSFTV